MGQISAPHGSDQEVELQPQGLGEPGTKRCVLLGFLTAQLVIDVGHH